MARDKFFLNPHMLGFDQLGMLIERSAKTGGDGYPPFNIAVKGGNRYFLTLAVAGFARDDLEIALAGNELSVTGTGANPMSEVGREFLHRGVASRKFRKTFFLADGMAITGATLENGLLTVEMRFEPRESEPVNIPING